MQVTMHTVIAASQVSSHQMPLWSCKYIDDLS
jgi:hypothetical protein